MRLSILVPTDFSNNSLVALRYALSIAEQVNADVHIVHAYKPFVSAFQSQVVNEADAHRAKGEAEIGLSDFLVRLGEQESVKVTSSTLKGNLLDVIEKYTVQTPVSLIVMGTHGNTGTRKDILGSNTYDVAKETKIPLLIVPEHSKGFEIKNVTFFTDYNKDDCNVLEALNNVFNLGSATCTMVHITDGTDEQQHEKLNDWANGLVESTNYNSSLETKVVVSKENINAVNDTIEALGADICLLTLVERRGFFERLLSKSLARAIILNPTVPVLLSGGAK